MDMLRNSIESQVSHRDKSVGRVSNVSNLSCLLYLGGYQDG